jgi:transposase-like protein
MYLYRAVDKAGKTVDFHVSQKRDVNAAKAFLRQAMKGQRTPTKTTLDAYAVSHRAVAELKDTGEAPKRVLVRSSKYLNNLIEQDHRANQATAWSDVGAEKLRHCKGGNRRHRTGGADTERTVQDEQAGRKKSDNAGNLAGGAGGRKG